MLIHKLNYQILASFTDMIGSKRPLTWVLSFWPVIVTSFAAALAATWLCKKIALKFNIVDKPDDLVKTHKEPIAYLGGIGIFVGLTVGIIVGAVCLRNEIDFQSQLKLLLSVLAGGAIICLVGVTDDIIDLKPGMKILGQVFAALILIFAGIVPDIASTTKFFHLLLPQNIEIFLQVLIVIVFVLGASNSLNLLDGLDGLCGGVTAIITVALLLLSIHLATWGASDVGDPVRIVICLGLVGSVCGFLPHNRHPAKIFMGDAGSMLLGFTVAALMILFAEGVPRWLMASIVVFGLPILDTATALARRLVNKRPLLVSDRGHIYDQMIDRGIPLKRTVTLCYLFAAVYAVTGLIMSQIRTRYASLMYIIVFVVSALIIWRKGYLKMEGLRGALRRNTKDKNQ
jgi:UDP-GlcNAc:undecaprenyl-phosphate GlcNAc-1-phosphate transferase